uniref:WW domain-binding protein 11 n=1 Tax=Steinernema glaseri TaxID=37863 RepID=A0A1I7ZD70_9BILA
MGKKDRVVHPADRERKRERQKEKSRNKKQRKEVRHSIVKARNPSDILENVRRLDDQEFDVKSVAPKEMFTQRREKLLNSFKEIINMCRGEKNERQARELEQMLRIYTEERAERENHFRAAKFAAAADPDMIPLPSGSGFMDPNVAYTPQGMVSMVPMRNPGKKPLPAGKVHTTPPGPPACFPQEMSDSEDEVEPEQPEEVQAEDNLAPVEMPANIFSGRQAMGLPLAPVMAPPPPPRPLYSVPYGMAPRQPVMTSNAVPAEATITAEPSLRNLRKEATLFVPTALRIRRASNKPPPPKRPALPRLPQPQGKSVDEAYGDFMKEMEGLL